jgi:hypothetical protein
MKGKETGEARRRVPSWLFASLALLMIGAGVTISAFLCLAPIFAMVGAITGFLDRIFGDVLWVILWIWIVIAWLVVEVDWGLVAWLALTLLGWLLSGGHT